MPEINRDAFPSVTDAIKKQIAADTKTIAAIHIDRMRVGKYKGIDLQGGMFYPAIKENLANGVVWAFNSTGTARGVARRAAANNGYVKLVLMQEGNVIGNKTFSHIWFNDLKESVANGSMKESKALRELNAVRKKYAKHPDSKLRTDHTETWKTLDQAFNDIVSMPQQKRASTYFQKSKTTTKAGEKIAYQSLLSQKMSKAGFPDAIKIVDSIEEPAFKNVPTGAAVGIIRIDPISDSDPILTGQQAGVPTHLSYDYVLKGKPVTKMTHYQVVDVAYPELKHKILSQQMTDFPVEKSIPGQQESMGQVRYMPSDTDYLAAVKAGDTKAAQQMVDQAAKAAGFTDEYFRVIPEDATITQEKYSSGAYIPTYLSKTPWEPFSGQEGYKTVKVWVKKGRQGVVADEDLRFGDPRFMQYTQSRFDSVTSDDPSNDTLVVFNVRNIKSSNPITRDSSGNVIPLSQRFQQSSADIRFMPQPDPSVPGAYSVTGGFRILPGKTNGRLRVYGPAGSLVGIAGSLDEAQRMIQRKTR